MHYIKTENKQLDKSWIGVEGMLKIDKASSQYLSIPHDVRFDCIDHTKDWSINLKCNPIAGDATYNIIGLLGKQNSTENGWIIDFAAGIRAYFINNASNIYGVKAAADLNILREVMITYQATGRIFKIYFNGREQSTVSVIAGTYNFTGTATTTDAITSSYHNIYGRKYSTAHVGDIVIYNKTLTSSEVLLTQNEIAIIPKSLHQCVVGHWTCNQRYGKVIWDSVEQYNYVKEQPFNVLNKGFDSDVSWTKSSGWTIADGVAILNLTVDNTVSNNILQSNIAVVNGRSYKVTFEIKESINAGGLGLRIIAGNTINTTNYLSVGIYSVIVIGQPGNLFGFQASHTNPSGSSKMVIDNVNIEPYSHGLLTANHGELINYTDAETALDHISGNVLPDPNFANGAQANTALGWNSVAGAVGWDIIVGKATSVNFNWMRHDFPNSVRGLYEISVTYNNGQGASLRVGIGDTSWYKDSVLETGNGVLKHLVPTRRIGTENIYLAASKAGVEVINVTFSRVRTIDTTVWLGHYSKGDSKWYKKATNTYDAPLLNINNQILETTGFPEITGALKLSQDGAYKGIKLNTAGMVFPQRGFYHIDMPETSWFKTTTATSIFVAFSDVDYATSLKLFSIHWNGASQSFSVLVGHRDIGALTAKAVAGTALSLSVVWDMTYNAGTTGFVEVFVNGISVAKKTSFSGVSSAPYGWVMNNNEWAWPAGGVNVYASRAIFGDYVPSRTQLLEYCNNTLLQNKKYKSKFYFLLQDTNTPVDLSGNNTVAALFGYTAAEITPTDPAYVIKPIHNLRMGI